MRMITLRTPCRTGTLLTTALALFALAGTGAHAQTYTKVGTAQDSLPATAQITQGIGALQEITGAFTFTTTGSERATVNVSNPDLFEIRIDGSALFSATTIGQPSSLFNPQLFLFNAAGAGVYYNDDASAFTTGALINPTTSPTPGLYFLGIATYGVVPRSGTGAAFDMFSNSVDDTTITDFTGLRTPKPGVSGPLTNWFLSSADVETGSYSIALTGASFASPPAVPEASTTVSFGLLLALGLGGLVVAARKKRAA